jgi:two-component sensor histidine kinase
MVSDNGPGIPKIDLETHKTLGLQLVYSLAKQLNAQIEVNRKKGTSFTFTFQLKV